MRGWLRNESQLWNQLRISHSKNHWWLRLNETMYYTAEKITRLQFIQSVVGGNGISKSPCKVWRLMELWRRRLILSPEHVTWHFLLPFRTLLMQISVRDLHTYTRCLLNCLEHKKCSTPVNMILDKNRLYPLTLWVIIITSEGYSMRIPYLRFRS